MAGRGKKRGEVKLSNTNRWNAAVYCRRSFDDGDIEESYTITNQRKMIEYYVSSNDDMRIIDYYSDDGYTGTNFNRPEFKRMLADVMMGKINTLIVKDLSRLGRNHREVGRYLEEVFPLYNLRVISLNDNVDSYKNPESINNIIIPVKNLMNESYARDISVKVRSAYVAMAKRGEYVAGTTPYGYKIDPEQKHHLVIDEDEAKIAKEIFKMALNGDGRIKICKYLNDNGILSRREIQRRKKYKLSLDPNKEEVVHFWGTTTIGRMLSNECYIGNLAQLKTRRESFGKKTILDIGKEDYIRVENTHEALIDKKDYEKVQKLIKHNSTKKKSTTKEKKYSIFNGILKCGECGRAMTRQEDFRNGRDTSNYFCQLYLRTSKKCSPHKIKTSDLEEIVLEAVQLQIKLVIKLERSLNKLYFKTNQVDVEDEYNNNIRLFEIKLDNLSRDRKTNYENWKSELITQEKFTTILNDIDNKENLIKEEMNSCELSYREKIKQIRKNDYWIGHYKRNRRIKKLTKETLHELVDTIKVYDDKNVEIIFKYQDECKNLINYLEKEGVITDEKMAVWDVSKTFV